MPTSKKNIWRIDSFGSRWFRLAEKLVLVYHHGDQYTDPHCGIVRGDSSCDEWILYRELDAGLTEAEARTCALEAARMFWNDVNLALVDAPINKPRKPRNA